jgi:hypothetical protein
LADLSMPVVSSVAIGIAAPPTSMMSPEMS